MTKKYYILVAFLLLSAFFSIAAKGQTKAVEDLSAETLTAGIDTNTTVIALSFKIINIDSLEEINILLIKKSKDTIFVTGKVIGKDRNGYKIDITNTLQHVGNKGGSVQTLNITLPKAEKGNISKIYFDTRQRGVKKSKKFIKVKKLKL